METSEVDSEKRPMMSNPTIAKTVLAWLVFAMTGHAQSCSPPPWYGSLPSGYIAAMGRGSSANSAADDAWAGMLTRLANAETNRIESRFSLSSSRYDGVSGEEIKNELVARGVVLSGNAPMLKVMATHSTPYPCKSGGYAHYLLVCRDGNGSMCIMKNPSDAAAVSRSALFPGWGQSYKGHNRRAFFFGSVMALFTAGAAVSFPASDNMYSKAVASRTAEARDHYASRRDLYYYCGIGLSAAALVIYVWNLFDARNIDGIPVLE